MLKRFITTKKVQYGLSLLALVGIVSGAAYAAFADKGEILGSSFSVGSADIKLYKDLSGGPTSENLTDSLAGPSFTNISSNWSADFPLKIYNNASDHIQLTSNAFYETINDPDDLRQILYVEPINWGDPNNNGIVEDGELGSTFGRKTLVKWKTEGYDLSSVAPGSTKGMILRFSSDAIPDTKQGKTAVFDFIFDSLYF